MEYKQITLTEIYIPICFYFNEDQNKEVSKLLLFTFHYVSILIFFQFCTIFNSMMDLHSNILEHNIYSPRQRQKTNYYNTKDFHL